MAVGAKATFGFVGSGGQPAHYDVLNQESLVHDGDPRQAAITMTPF